MNEGSLLIFIAIVLSILIMAVLSSGNISASTLYSDSKVSYSLVNSVISISSIHEKEIMQIDINNNVFFGCFYLFLFVYQDQTVRKELSRYPKLIYILLLISYLINLLLLLLLLLLPVLLPRQNMPKYQ